MCIYNFFFLHILLPSPNIFVSLNTLKTTSLRMEKCLHSPPHFCPSQAFPAPKRVETKTKHPWFNPTPPLVIPSHCVELNMTMMSDLLFGWVCGLECLTYELLKLTHWRGLGSSKVRINLRLVLEPGLIKIRLSPSQSSGLALNQMPPHLSQAQTPSPSSWPPKKEGISTS